MDYRMNYYELYGFAPGFLIDAGLLKQRYYELSRRYHPDFYRPEPGETADALDLSSAVNKGYGLFQQRDSTIQYLLQLKGLLADDEKYALPPAFLGEVMELNETLMELEIAPDAAKLARCARETKALALENEAAVAPFIMNYKDGLSTAADLLPVKEYYFKQKYLRRILDKVDTLGQALQ
jgi:molecular chaperone HscB